MKRVSLSSFSLFIILFFIAGHFSTIEAKKRPQPNMKAALVYLNKAQVKKVGNGKIIQLNKAKAFLEKASSNKGGHRVKAIALINQALAKIKAKRMKAARILIRKAKNQVKKGIAFAIKHAR